MNSNLQEKVKETGKSIYKISQESGIPYTTLNELMNEKKNINNTSAETVYKLSQYAFMHKNDVCGSLMIDDETGALKIYND